MPTTTPKLGLIKPATVGEVVDISQLNANADKLDTAINQVVTSTTRPASPYDGQVVFESDKNRTIAWDAGNSRWIFIGGQMDWSQALAWASGWREVGDPAAVPLLAIGPGHRVYCNNFLARRTSVTTTTAFSNTDIVTGIPTDWQPVFSVGQPWGRGPYSLTTINAAAGSIVVGYYSIQVDKINFANGANAFTWAASDSNYFTNNGLSWPSKVTLGV